MHFVVIYGLPGVGKKTIGMALETLTGYPLLDNHSILDIVRKFVPWPSPESTALGRNIRRDIIRGALAAGSKGIITTVAGGSQGARETVKEWVDIVEKSGGRVSFVELKCRTEVLLTRIANPSRRGTFKTTTKEELDEFLKKDYFKGLPERESFTLDITDTSPIQAAEHIQTYINDLIPDP